MKKLSKQNALDLLKWFNTEGQNNWGSWGKYPNLPVSASYLSYDTNKCQINLTPSIELDGQEYNCITNSRPVGNRWTSPISLYDLKSLFSITDEEINAAIQADEKAEKLKFINWQLKAQSGFLENDSYEPFVADIEKIFLKSEITSDNFIEPLGMVRIAHSEIVLKFDTPVEWTQVRLQGRNGGNKKRVFKPIAIPADIQEQISEALEMAKTNRKEQLKATVSDYKAQLAELTV